LLNSNHVLLLNLATTLPLTGLALYSLVVGDPKDPSARKRAALVSFGVMLPLMVVEAFASWKLTVLRPLAIPESLPQRGLLLMLAVWGLTIALLVVRMTWRKAWAEVVLELLRRL